MSTTETHARDLNCSPADVVTLDVSSRAEFGGCVIERSGGHVLIHPRSWSGRLQPRIVVSVDDQSAAADWLQILEERGDGQQRALAFRRTEGIASNPIDQWIHHSAR